MQTRTHVETLTSLSDAFDGDYRTDLDLVFAAPAGEYLRPVSVTAKVYLVAQQRGLKRVGLHSLRHTHWSQLLNAGVSLPAVSKRLGHSSVSTTAKIYAHIFAADDASAAQVWETHWGNGSSPKTRQKVWWQHMAARAGFNKR